jgi:hypothetical protein
MIIISVMGRARTETALLPKTALFPPLVWGITFEKIEKSKIMEFGVPFHSSQSRSSPTRWDRPFTALMHPTLD